MLKNFLSSLLLYLVVAGTYAQSEVNLLFDADLRIIRASNIKLQERIDFKEILKVYRINKNQIINDVQILGDYQLDGSNLTFKPKIPFSSTSNYLAKLKIDKQTAELSFTGDKLSSEQKPLLLGLYPSISELPMNQLKIYIEFNNPIKSGQSESKIKLLEMPEEKLVEDAFLRISEELWDEEHKRLTLFFDPGRIKIGVAPNIQLGLPLNSGNHYRLIVEAGWKDQYGGKTSNRIIKEFKVSDLDRISPAIKPGNISSIQVSSQNPLIIDFSEPMDYGLLKRLLAVTDQNGVRIAGKVKVANNESIWIFVPNDTWNDQSYYLNVNTWLEDLAGNNLIRLFDEDIRNRSQEEKEHTTIKIPIEIQSPVKLINP